jgi:hypothetical protein
MTVEIGLSSGDVETPWKLELGQRAERNDAGLTRAL